MGRSSPMRSRIAWYCSGPALPPNATRAGSAGRMWDRINVTRLMPIRTNTKPIARRIRNARMHSLPTVKSRGVSWELTHSQVTADHDQGSGVSLGQRHRLERRIVCAVHEVVLPAFDVGAHSDELAKV